MFPPDPTPNDRDDSKEDIVDRLDDLIKLADYLKESLHHLKQMVEKGKSEGRKEDETDAE